LIYQRGVEQFYRQAKQAGIDGVLVPDVPVEESIPFVMAARKAGISPIFLVSQTTTNQRLAKILQHAQGYLYLVSVLGVTGERNKLPGEVLSLIERVKAITGLPIAVGFGISKPSHIKMLKKAGVDGYIIGSALIKIIEENIGKNRDKLLRELEGYVATLLCWGLGIWST